MLSGFLTPFNLQIFELLVDNSYSVRDLAKAINCSPAKVTQFIRLFGQHGLVEIKRDKNRKIVGLDRKSVFVRELISLIFVSKIINSRAFAVLKKSVKSIGVYGSVADGTVDKHSDIDLWVLAEQKSNFADSGETRQKFVKELKREVSLKFFTLASLKTLKEKDKIFYNELSFKSKVLHGDGFA